MYYSQSDINTISCEYSVCAAVASVAAVAAKVAAAAAADAVVVGGDGCGYHYV